MLKTSLKPMARTELNTRWKCAGRGVRVKVEGVKGIKIVECLSRCVPEEGWEWKDGGEDVRGRQIA